MRQNISIINSENISPPFNTDNKEIERNTVIENNIKKERISNILIKRKKYHSQKIISILF